MKTPNMLATATSLTLRRKPYKLLEGVPTRSPEQIHNPKDNKYRKMYYNYLNSWLPEEINKG